MKNFYLGLLCVLLAVTPALSQSKKKKQRKSPATMAYNKQNDENARFLNKQWWIGAKGGVNLSSAHVTAPYAIISPTNYTLAKGTGKKYESFKQMGSLAAVEITFFYNALSFSLQPSYQHAIFTYTNEYEWANSDDATHMLPLKIEHEQKIDHFVIPLVVKYEFAGNKLRPYFQLGAYTAMLINATKSARGTGVDYASGGDSELKDPPIVVGARDLFAKNHWGLIGGLGVYYSVGNIRLNFDAQYRYGQSNISSVKNRYSNDMLGTGAFDAMDDLTLDNINLSLGCLFPLRFLEDGFKSMNRKK
jgi:hypothetical protein